MAKTVRLFSYLSLLGCLLALSACGAKGDLFLPEQVLKKAASGVHLKSSDQPDSKQSDTESQSDTSTDSQQASEPQPSSDQPDASAHPGSPVLPTPEEDKQDKTVQ